MGVFAFEINPHSSPYSANSFPPSSSSYAIPISSRPFFRNVLNTRVSSKFHSRKLNFVPPLNASLNFNADSLPPKHSEFKPSFDDYLKAMESRTSRMKKKMQQQQNDSSSSSSSSPSTTSTIRKEDMKKGNDEFEAPKEEEKVTTVIHKQGSSTSSDVSVRGRRIRGFKNEYDDTKESEIDVKGKQKNRAIVSEEGVWLKGQNHSVENSEGKSGIGRISYVRTKSDLSYSRGIIGDLSGEKVLSDRQRVKAYSGNNIAASNKVVESGFVRRNTEIESVESRNGSANVNLNRSIKRVVDKGYDSHNNVEVERAAVFSNFEDGVRAESHEANVREGEWLRHRSHGLEPESDNCSMVNKSRGKTGSGRISDNITSFNSNYNGGEKVASSGQRDYDTQGRGSGGNKIIASNKVGDRGFVRRNTEIESAVSRNGRENLNLNRSSKRFVDRGYDSDDVEVERAAFMNFEDGGIRKQQFSHKEMEERIQKLSRTLNGADIDLPEWMFSKMIRSARIKFNDYSITRVIILLGQLGNWRRVIQVIEWLQRRERFKSHKLRHIYTAALDALRKSRRPVEALNIFHTMLQQMSSYPDLVAYHSIAVTLGQAGHMKELFDVVDIMRSPPKKKFKTGPFENWDPRLEPDTVVYDAVLNACVKRKQWEGAFWVLQQLKQQGQQPSATTYGLVMEVMFSCGKYNLVHEFFRKIQKSYIPNSLTYRVLVNTLWKEGKTNEAVLTVQEMENRGIVGSASLYYDLARCLCAAGRSHEALMQIDKICKVANKPLVVTYTGLMQACLDSGNIQDGAFIFEKMKEVCSPNLVTCNLLLKAYLDQGMFQEAKELFEQMSENTNQLTGRADYKMLVIPDIYTFNTMLDACVAEKRWDYFDYVYQRMLNHGFHFNAKRHLRMVLEASRAGKEGPLEITWKHLTETGRNPPAPLMKEMFCLKLEKDEYASAVTCITNNTPKDVQAFSKSSWLNLLKENSHRFQKDRLVRLVNEVSNDVSNSNSPNLILVYLIQSCKEFLRASGLNVADKDSVKTVVAVESELVASSR